MPDLVIHPATARQLQIVLASPAHGILLHGKVGVGLDTIAADIVAKLAGGAQFVRHIWPEKTGISIEQIRTLYVETRSNSEMRRVFVLHAADQMVPAAQTAFLKLLEEPTPNTHFILLAHAPQKLLPTIHSRIQATELLPITKEQTADLLLRSHVDAKIAGQMRFIAHGLPAELHRLIEDESYRQYMFDLAAQAKQLLSGTLEQRLFVVQAYSADRVQAEQLLRLVGQMLEFQIMAKPDKSLLQTLERVLDIAKNLGENANTKAQLLRFALTI